MNQEYYEAAYEVTRETFDFLLSSLAAINTVVQFFGTAAIFFTLFLFGRPSVRLVKKVLRPLGYSFRHSPSLLWKIRGNPNRLSRMFIEICIIESAGEYQREKSWWHERLNDLALMRKYVNEDYIPIRVSNCSNLGVGNDEFCCCVENYFASLRGMMNKLNITESDFPLRFVCAVEFQEGFLMPISLITGLMDKYNQDWEPIVNKFAYTKVMNDSNILPEELYFTFGWIVWNPSYELHNQQDYDKLFQYAFGDENNSINVVMKNNHKSDEIWSEIYKDSDSVRPQGLLCVSKCFLYESEYIDKYLYHLCPEAHYFARKMRVNSKHVFVCDDIERIKTYKAQNYYYTAYIWIMFEWVTDNQFFDPNNTMTFFEHANLANGDVVTFLEERLVEKAIAHFRGIFAQEKHNDRKYRYCLSFSKSIYKRFCDRYNQVLKEGGDMAKEFENRLDPVAHRNAADIFVSFDNDVDSTACKYYEICYKDKESLALLAHYYATVFLDAFPRADIRESLDNMIEYLRRKEEGWYGKNNYHIFIGKTDKNIISGVICDYFAEVNVGAIEYIAVNNSTRQKGYAREIFLKAVDILTEDARLAGFKRLDWIIAEIENVDWLAGELQETLDASYLYTWEKLGFQIIDWPSYVQPALSEDKEDMRLLLIAYKPKQSDQKEGLNEIPSSVVAGFIRNYARLALRIDAPDSHPAIQRMLGELSEAGQSLRLKPFKNMREDVER